MACMIDQRHPITSASSWRAVRKRKHPEPPPKATGKDCTLITTRTPPTSTTHTLHLLVLLELLAGHATDTGGIEIGFFRLDAAETAEFLVALLLPFRDEVGVGVVVFEEVVVEGLGDC